MNHFLLSSVWLLLLLWRDTEGGYVPEYSPSAQISAESAYRYPSTTEETGDKHHFISDLNFEILNGTLVTGSSNRLVFLSVDDLSPLYVYEWLATDNHSEVCRNPNDSPAGSVSTLEDPDFICNNHIRVYQWLPSNPSQLLVCGTQAVTRPQCRILEISLAGGRVEVEEFEAVNASDGLVSYFPQFSQFGQFRATDDADSVFLSGGFFPVGNTGVGRHFSISYKNITMTTPSDPDTLQTTELYRTINANNNWLRFPVTFVGSQRADYSSSFSPTNRDTDYQFWFLFLRENLVTDDIIYSRLVRVCRNDPGSTQTSDGARYFTTFMKARIFCERDKPSSLEFTGTLDYVYNSITSFVFSEEGRYYGSDAAPKRLLYGSFSGPSNGPIGSALCVYPADNSVETSQGSGRTKSVFDIFREDITSDVTAAAVENRFLECAPEGRQDDQQQLLFINPDVSVEQIGDDPILVLDDVTVTEMVQDRVCVVTRENSSRCINQDILFLGLDSGRVLKVVFGTEENGDIEPIIAEDIELDDNNAVIKMAIEQGSGMLYVSTWSKVYSFPVQRCARFYTCSECVGARDPHCMWSDESLQCVATPLSITTTGTVNNTLYFQNIHTGNAVGCNYPEIGFSEMSVSVNEGMTGVSLSITSSAAGLIELYLEEGTATAGVDYQMMISQVISFAADETLTVPVTLLGDTVVEGDEWFIGRLRGTANEGVILTNDVVNITIRDDDSVNVSFSANSYSVGEGSSFVTVTIDKVGDTNFFTSVSLHSSDDTALAGDDYLSQDLWLTFDPTTTSVDVVIPLVNDDIMEAEEGFSLSLSLLGDGVQSTSLVSPITSTVVISDNDEVSLSLSTTTPVITEEEGSVTVQLTKSGATVLPVTVQVSTVNATATAPHDFTAITDDIITFSANQSSVLVTVALVDDVIAEEEEGFSVRLSLVSESPPGVRLGERETSITIRDSDTVILRLAQTVYTWSERDGEVAVVIEKIGSNERVITTSLFINPITARVGLDYLTSTSDIQFTSSETQKEVTIAMIVDDNELENVETLTLSLAGGSGAAYDDNSYGNVTILDDDEVVVYFDLSSCELTVAESAGYVEIVLAVRGLSSIPVEVRVQIQNGTATETTDFTVPAVDDVYTISPSSPPTPASLLIPIVDDTTLEMRAETFSVAMVTDQGGVRVADNGTVVVTIVDDDSVSVLWSPPGVYTVSETAGDVELTIIREGHTSTNITLTLDISRQQLTTAGVVYSPVRSVEVVVSAREETVRLAVAEDDELVELRETLVVAMTTTEERVMVGDFAVVYVTSDDVVVVGFQEEEEEVPVLEGERAELVIISNSTAPFDIVLSARVQSSDSLALLRTSVVMATGTTNTTLPVYAVPNMGGERGAGLVAEVVLELEDGTETSVQLGPHSKLLVSILHVDICSTATTSGSASPSNPVKSPSVTMTTTKGPEVVPPSRGGLASDDTECLYPSNDSALAVTVVLALVTATLSITNILTLLLCLGRRQPRPEKMEECDLQPTSSGGDDKLGVANQSFMGGESAEEKETVFTNKGAGTPTSSHGDGDRPGGSTEHVSSEDRTEGNGEESKL